MDATEQLNNVVARIQVWFDALVLTGTPSKVYQNVPRIAGDTGAFVRMTLQWLPSESRGHKTAAVRVDEAAVMAVFDLFWPKLEVAGDAFGGERIASEILSALRGLSLDFKDYSTTPLSPVDIAQHPIRFLAPATPESIPEVDGYTRLRVVSTARWFLLHS